MASAKEPCRYKSKEQTKAEPGIGNRTDQQKSQRAQEQKQRAVYIKMRPILGIDTTPLIGLYADLRKNAGVNIQKVEDASYEFLGTHWAIEIGPWTIELTKHPFTSHFVYMQSTHMRDINPVWEKESARMKVGTTRALDRELADPGNLIENTAKRYDMFKMNCQRAAAMLAISISEDRPAAFDQIFHCEQRSIFLLNMVEELKHLKNLESWSWNDSAYYSRAGALVSQMIKIEGDFDDADVQFASRKRQEFRKEIMLSACKLYSVCETKAFKSAREKLSARAEVHYELLDGVRQNMSIKSFLKFWEAFRPDRNMGGIEAYIV